MALAVIRFIPVAFLKKPCYTVSMRKLAKSEKILVGSLVFLCLYALYTWYIVTNL